jgi:multiple sugar transport system permease protein
MVVVMWLAWASCVPATAAPVTELTFSFWGSYKDLEFWQRAAETFEARNPEVRLTLQYTPYHYGEKLQLQFLSGAAADLLLMDDENYPAYAARGYLEDLAPYIAQDRAALRVDDYFGTALQAFTFRGFLGGLPWGGSPVLIFYNKDLFEAAGLPAPDPAWTWDDFRAISRKLTRDTDGDGRADQFGNMLGFGFLDMEPVLWAFGGRILTDDYSRAAIDSPGARAGLQYLQDLKFVDHSLVWFGDYQGMSKEVAILTGKIGMSVSSWFSTQVLNDAKGAMRWDVAPMPRGPDGQRVTRVTWDGISINAATTPEKKAIAWRFIRDLLDEPNQARIAQSGRGVPVVRAFAEKYFIDPATPVDERLALDAIDYGRITPVTAKYLQLKARSEYWLKLLEQENPADRKTPDEILPALAKEIDEVLASELDKDFGKARETVVARDATQFRLVTALLALIAAGLLFAWGRRNVHLREDLRMMRHSKMRRAEALHGFLFAAPWFFGFLFFLAFPIGFSLVLSFSHWDPYDPIGNRTFVGMDNYVEALTKDPLVWHSLRKTFLYAFVAVPLTLAGSLGLALLLNQRLRGIGLFRTLFYLPNVVGGVATAVMWTYIFNPIFGPINGGLRAFNDFLAQTPLAFLQLPEPRWLQDPDWAMPALILMMLWGTGGAGMLVFLAGLQGVPRDLYEAADLDGAGRLRKFWSITLPMLTPTIYFNLVMGLIGGLQVFMQAYILVGREGGPGRQLLFYVLYLYNRAFIEYDFGYAAALAWILFAIILAFTLLVIRSSAMWVYYEGERGR